MEFRVKRNGCFLHCNIEGEGPGILLIHGVGSDHHYFQKAVELLKKNFTVVTYDRCGYSQSKFPDAEVGEDKDRHSTVEQARDAKAILDVWGLKHIILVGVSAGSMVALEFAAQFPEYVDKLLIYEPLLATSQEYIDRINQLWDELYDLTERKKLAQVIRTLVNTLDGADPEAESKPMAQLAQDLQNMKVFVYKERENQLSFWDKGEAARRMKMPCALGTGTYDPQGLAYLVGPECAQALGARFYRVAGYHNVAEERPGVFADWIHTCIQDLESEKKEM